MDDLLKPATGPLIVYTRKFAALIEAGVSLMRSMALLRDTTEDQKMKDATEHLMARVEAGDHLSQAMAQRPEVFSRFSIAFVRAGEIGGVLDEALCYLADWLEQEREAEDRLQSRALLVKLARGLGAGGASLDARARGAFSRAREMARIASFCRLWEMCLSAGVPLRLALTTAVDVLSEEQSAELRTRIEHVADNGNVSGVLAAVAEMKAVVAPMVAIGEEHGCLDHMLRKAAQFYDAEATGILDEAGQVAG